MPFLKEAQFAINRGGSGRFPEFVTLTLGLLSRPGHLPLQPGVTWLPCPLPWLTCSGPLRGASSRLL